MLRVISLNCNGIRSSSSKGLFDWLTTQNADIICLQETRANLQNFEHNFHFDGYFSYFFDAQKKGYSGVGIYSRKEPVEVIKGLGWPVADNEGRYIQLNFSNLTIASLYLPSGTSGFERQSIKYDFMAKYLPKLTKIKKNSHNFIICGDWNIAHQKIDLKHWAANQNSSGFLPDERAWMDKIFLDVGLVDAFRELNKEPGQYTWWSNFGNAWHNNSGWRIDYQIVTPDLKDKIIAVNIYKSQRFSDHAPLIIDYDIEF